VLVGDAAGLANPITGGGIINAMVSGKIAAEVLAEKLPQDTLSVAQLQEYAQRVKKLFGKELWFSRGFLRILRVSPYFVERFFQSARWAPWAYGLINHIYQDIRFEQIRHNGHDGVRPTCAKASEDKPFTPTDDGR